MTIEEKKKYGISTQTKQPANNAPTQATATAGRDANGNLVGTTPQKDPFNNNMETWLGPADEVQFEHGELPEGVTPIAKGPLEKTGGSTTPVQPGDGYSEAMDALKSAQQSMPTYAGTYDAELEDIYKQIVNREKFSYDLNADMLYDQYKDQYINLGRMAMKDSMGQAAALTGGYGSSYGQAVGQQQYDAYLQQLNEVVPELYGMALDQYNAEGSRLADIYAMTGDLAADEYGKYQDSLDRYWQDRDRAYSEIISLITSTGYMPTAEELAAAGLTQEQADALVKTWRAENPDIAYNNGTITAEEYKQITGKYPKGYKKSGGSDYTNPGKEKTLKDYAQELIDQGYTPREVNDAISQAPGYSPEEKRDALIVGIGGAYDPYDR